TRHGIWTHKEPNLTCHYRDKTDSGDSKEWSRLKRHKRPRAPAATIFCRPFTHIHPQVLLTAQSACGWTSVTHF
ncbi:hypothetical protein CH063_00377, partial [Colletotrichum higginsianum]